MPPKALETLTLMCLSHFLPMSCEALWGDTVQCSFCSCSQLFAVQISSVSGRIFPRLSIREEVDVTTECGVSLVSVLCGCSALLLVQVKNERK